MSDKSSALRAKSDDADARQLGLPDGFDRLNPLGSLLVAQMAYAIPRSSRLANGLKRSNGTAHSALRGH